MRRLLALSLLAALALSACGTSTTPTPKFKGSAKDVADQIDKLAAAGRRGDAKTICDDILASQLLTQLKTAGGDCESEMKDAIRDANDFDLNVRAVKVTGNNATAQVQQGDKGKTATFTFVKEGNAWKASALGGS
jgi:hypothetical protein